MVTPTSDSPAGATGLGDAVTDFIRDNAGSEDNSQWAISEHEGQNADPEYDGYDGEYTEEGEDYDSVADEILGIQQQGYEQGSEDPNPVPYERFREVNERARQASEYEARLNRWGRVIEQLESQGFQDASNSNIKKTRLDNGINSWRIRSCWILLWRKHSKKLKSSSFAMSNRCNRYRDICCRNSVMLLTNNIHWPHVLLNWWTT
jgi:hypothetical protein